MRLAYSVAVILTASSLSFAEARSLADLFGGYSLLNGNTSTTASGWELSYTQNLKVNEHKPWLGIEGDLSAHHQSFRQGHSHLHTLTFGPQFTKSFRSFTFTSHSSAGLVHTAGVPGSHNGVAFALGGGAEWKINELWGVRVAQVDYSPFRFARQWQNNVRISSGIALHLIGFFDHVRRLKDTPERGR
jgi:hypothetical protein